MTARMVNSQLQLIISWMVQAFLHRVR